MPNQFSQLIHQLNYTFSDVKLVELALTHRSYGATNNERLEFLGDSIVNFLIAEALYKQFPNAREGELSRMRAQLVKGVTLAEMAREFNVGEYLRLGTGEMKSGGFRRDSILADAMEALIGAMYLDGGMDVCREKVLAWYGSRLNNISPNDSNKDAKTQLQEYLQARKRPLPVYELVQTCGEEHAQQFEVLCRVEGVAEAATGCGSSRRNAEQQAAANALLLLRETS